jgi:hypothetical protein
MGEPNRLVRRRGFWGLTMAADCFADGDNCPTLVTYGPRANAFNMVSLVTTEPGKGTLQETLALGRGMVAADHGVHSYVLWWDGFLTMKGQRTDVVFCEAGVRGEESAFVFVLPYVVEDGKFVKLGRPKLLGRAEQAFKAPVSLPPNWKAIESQGRKRKAGPSPSRPKRHRT